jgi:hypothetical protein
MSYRAICIAAVAALGIVWVSVDALAARRAGLGYDEPWYNPDYSTGSYSPSYSTGGYRHPGYSIKFSSVYDRSGYSARSYAWSDHTAGYCARRFKSYDPGSGTYFGHDGRWHPCP